jgi:hypothetical protein
MSTTIQIKRSSTASGVPLSTDLAVGELAVNLADKRLFTKQSDGTIIELSTNPTDLDAATLRIDGVEITASATELNKLDGFTGSTAELNILDGVTATTTELNYVDGVTSNIQTQLDNKADDTTSPTLTLDGDVSGSATLTNLGDATLTVTVADDSHNHTIANVDGLQTSLDSKAPTASPTFTGTATIPSVDINGGAIDNTIIGGNMATQGNFTDVEAGSVTVTGAITGGSADISGTVQADGLTVDNAGVIAASFNGGSAATYVRWSDATDNWFIGTNNGLGGMLFKNETADANRFFIGSNGDVLFYEDTGTTPKMTWSSSAESLGIGTNSPAQKLDVVGSGDTFFKVGNGTYNTYIGTESDNSYIGNDAPKGIRFATNGSERARIDSSGNLLVGKTYTASSIAGQELRAGGYTAFTRSGGNPLELNRLGSDGAIVNFSKDGSTVGSIASDSGNILQLNSGGNDKGVFLARNGVNVVGFAPNEANVFRPATDNLCDLGASTRRFDDIYATNGTIQTSDRNEKQDIEVLNEAEQRVAQACKGLLRKFRWKDSVAEKGDEARIHFGIIAQDLRDAFIAEGLDAGRYAMFISTTWTDEETGEERTRLGVRYPELLAFIISTL